MKNKFNFTEKDVDYLLSPAAIRTQATRIFELTQAGKTHFQYHPEKLNETVEYVLKAIYKNYPELNIPFHSRWGHFRVGGVDRTTWLHERIRSLDRIEQARIKLDLAITSVLLDAGSGPGWKYLEDATGKTFARSEGLGVASFHMFMKGAMSSGTELRADGEALKNISHHQLEKYFQVDGNNPLVGVKGRVALLNNLGKTCLEQKNIFKDGRPGNIIDYLIEKYGQTIPATGVLRAVLDGLGPIWPGRINLGGKNLGDVWQHSTIADQNSLESLVPFHKLSQWMSYSLMEPIMEAGITVTGVETLTGLAEYRNGGLILDMGLVTFKDPSLMQKPLHPETDIIIEWRALTVYLLDMIGKMVQDKLGKTPQDFPLAKVLEGGTWWAGRFIAAEKRAGGGPPLQIESDGTVF